MWATTSENLFQNFTDRNVRNWSRLLGTYPSLLNHARTEPSIKSTEKALTLYSIYYNEREARLSSTDLWRWMVYKCTILPYNRAKNHRQTLHVNVWVSTMFGVNRTLYPETGNIKKIKKHKTIIKKSTKEKKQKMNTKDNKGQLWLSHFHSWDPIRWDIRKGKGVIEID